MFREKIIFMGTPDISSIYLQTLINNNFNIIAAFTQPPRKKNRGLSIQKSSVHKLANLHKINIFTPTNLNDEKVQKKFKNLEIGSYPFFQQGKIGVSLVLRSVNSKLIDKCINDIMKFVKKKKIKVIARK